MTLAIKVTFSTELETYSDEEGLIPNRVGRTGLERTATVVDPADLTSLYVIIEDDEVPVWKIHRLMDQINDGYEQPPLIIWDAPAGFPFMSGPEGEPIENVEEVALVQIEDRTRFVKSVAIARNQNQTTENTNAA